MQNDIDHDDDKIDSRLQPNKICTSRNIKTTQTDHTEIKLSVPLVLRKREKVLSTVGSSLITCACKEGYYIEQRNTT